MWSIGIGVLEIGVLVLFTGALALMGKRARRWMIGLAPCAAIGMAASPADPASMFIVAIPLMLAFTCGVFAARFVAPTREFAEEKAPRA